MEVSVGKRRVSTFITQNPQVNVQVSGSTRAQSPQNMVFRFVAVDNQTQFTLPSLPAFPSLTMLFINGVKYEFLEDYTIFDYVVTWLGFYLKEGYRIEFYY